ncbi:GNAT family N-acetyltransferase [Salinicoccus sp. HZC-1]|uniref:GNAT family N-acetyltransferase n=1 Tax=Salinicoccus sp. HZC-1 TaxID=3385497 RepID=UPI00398BA728
MLKLRKDRSFNPGDISTLYLSKGYSTYENRLDELYEAVISSDYVITAWDDSALVGIIRSSGDMKFTQFISDLIVHPEYKTKGLASKLMNTYMTETSDVDEIFLMMDPTPKNSFTKNWLIYNGFDVISETDKQMIYLKTRGDSEE